MQVSGLGIDETARILARSSPSRRRKLTVLAVGNDRGRSQRSRNAEVLVDERQQVLLIELAEGCGDELAV